MPPASPPAPVTPLLRPPRQDSSGPRPPRAGPHLWGLRGAERNLSLLPLPAWPTCTSSSRVESPRQGTPSGEASLNSGREGQASSFVSPMANTCPPCRGGPGSSLTPHLPLLWPVSLGAISQSCLLPVSKTCSFPSENINHFLASQRTAWGNGPGPQCSLCTPFYRSAGQGCVPLLPYPQLTHLPADTHPQPIHRLDPRTPVYSAPHRGLGQVQNGLSGSRLHPASSLCQGLGWALG